jgi:hypothetical protein
MCERSDESWLVSDGISDGIGKLSHEPNQIVDVARINFAT